MKIFRETDVFKNAADMIYVSSRIALKHVEPIHMHEFIDFVEIAVDHRSGSVHSKILLYTIIRIHFSYFPSSC